MNLTAPWRLLLAGFSIRVVQSLVVLQPISFCVYFSIKCLSRTHNENYSLAFFSGLPSSLSLSLSHFSPTPLSFFFSYTRTYAHAIAQIRTHMHRRTHNNAYTHIHIFVFSHSLIRISHQHRFALRVLHTRYLSVPLCHHPFSYALSMKTKQYYYY